MYYFNGFLETKISLYIDKQNALRRDILFYYIESKKGSKYQESIQSSTTPDPGYHMGNWQKHN